MKKEKKKEYQWGWIIEYCSKCNEQSQMPVADEIGDDCNLWDEFKRMKEEGNVCVCGEKLVYKTSK